MSQPGTVEGAVYEFHAARARLGSSPGVNSPLTTRAFDTSENGNHGTLTTFAGTTASGWAGAGTLADPYRLVFDGASDYVACPDLGACEDGVYSYEGWFVAPASDVGYLPIVSEGAGADVPAAFLTVRLGAVMADSWGAGFATRAYVHGPAVTEGTIHHAVMTSDASYLRLYVDGEEVGVAVTPLAAFNTNRTTVGMTFYDTKGVGSIFVARIYPFALSAAEVAQNYAAGYLGDPAPRFSPLLVTHDWKAALESPARVDVVTCAAYLGAEHVADLSLTDGSVSADGRRATMRTATLEIAPDGSYTHEQMYALLATPGLELRPRRGVMYADGEVETKPLGCFVIDELSFVETAAGTQLSAQCSDVSVRIQRAILADPYQMAGGDSLAEVVIAALQDRYAAVSVGFTASTVPDDLAASVVLGLGSSSNPWSELQAVMEAHGWLLYLDADGVVQATAPISPSYVTPTYTYARGAAALVTERTRSLPLDAAYNGVIVTGEGSGVTTPVRGEAWDTDPRSPTYYLGPFGQVPKFISTSLVTTEAQAVTMATLDLALATGRRDEFSFAALVRPELAPLDVVGMERADGGPGVYVVDQVTTPLSPTGTQSATTRSSVAEG
jgi:hypothetical protein